MSTLTYWKYRILLVIKGQIIQTLFCQTQSFIVYISTGHKMEGKEYQATKGKSILSPTLSPCSPLLSLKGSCRINSKKKPDCQYWELWWLKRHINQFWYFVPKKLIFLFLLGEERDSEICQNILSLLTLICITFVCLKYLLVWEFFPKQYMNY